MFRVHFTIFLEREKEINYTFTGSLFTLSIAVLGKRYSEWNWSIEYLSILLIAVHLYPFLRVFLFKVNTDRQLTMYMHTHTHRYMYARANKWICSFFLFLFLIRIYKDGRSGKWLSQSVCHSSGNKQCVQSIPSCALYAVVVLLLSLLFLFPSLERRVPRNGNCLIRGRRVPLSRSGSL